MMQVWAAMLVALPLLSDEPEPAAVLDDPTPTAPGIHHLAYDTQVDGRPERMTYGLFIPDGYAERVAAGEKVPMMVYLCGKGARGHEAYRLYYNGPLAEMKRVPALRPSIDFVVVAPQCPREHRWESQVMGRFVIECAQRVADRLAIDRDRIHLAGMSMGGEGGWYAADAAPPDMFATVSLISGRRYSEDPGRVAEKLKDTTVWLIVGNRDGDFTSGSEAMAEALDAAGADVTLTIVPRRGHDIWGMYYAKPEYYRWLMLHNRRQFAPPPRPGPDAMAHIAEIPPPDPEYGAFAERLQTAFGRFRPNWFIADCARDDRAGLQAVAARRRHVFATMPVHRAMPCRMMTTTTIPADRQTTLHLEVGVARNQQGAIAVSVDGETVLQRRIRGRRADEENWQSIAVDLTPYAGREVELEILHRGDAQALYWDRIGVVSE